MKKYIFIIIPTIILFSNCSSTKVLTSAKTYENFRGFEPIDPIEYLEEVAIVEQGVMVFKYPITLNKDEILGFLGNETVFNQTTIQSAMQAMATIKSKIYENGTELYPQVMAIKSEDTNSNSNKEFKDQVEMKSLK